MKPFWLAIQFLTRLPSPHYKTVTAKEMGALLPWFPLVGLIVGGALWATSQLEQWLPTDLVAGLVLAVWVWITGGLHLDGLADSADGWLGAKGDPQRALAIMRDSAIGSGGGIALGLMLLLKWLTLSHLLTSHAVIWLLFVPVLARTAALALMRFTVYARRQGLASEMLRHQNRVLNGVVLALILLVLFWASWEIALLLIAVTFWNRWWMVRLTGGLTGDTAGASIETAELALLIGVLLWS